MEDKKHFMSIDNSEYVENSTGEIISYKDAIKVLLDKKQSIQSDIDKEIRKIKKDNDVLERKDTHFFNWNNKGNPTLFVKKYKVFSREVSKMLSINEKAMLFVLSDYIETETNQIVIKGSRYPSNKVIGELVGLKNTATSNTISSLKDKGILATRGKGKEREIFLNPFLAFDGKDISRETLKMFNMDV